MKIKLFLATLILAVLVSCGSNDSPIQYKYTLVVTNLKGSKDTIITPFKSCRQTFSINDNDEVIMQDRSNYYVIYKNCNSFTIINEEQAAILKKEIVKKSSP